MAATLDLSHQFASLVKQLHQSPDNPALQNAVVRRLPEMMALAKVNPLAQYRLAQMHSPTSPQYKQMMRQSANMGCTNAMLAVCELLLKSNASADLKTAAHYMDMIEQSKDTYILKQSRDLLEAHPGLAAFMKAEFKFVSKSDSYNMGNRFFKGQSERNSSVEIEEQNQFVI